MTTKAEQRYRTRAEIVRIATRRFTESGYTGVALEDLVAEAQLTRGALYHHFGSKLGLFQAVVDQAQRGVAEAVELAANAHDGPLDAFLAGCRAFLDASLAPEVRRILLIEGPAVLGWGDWREGDLETSVLLLDEGVAELAASGVIDGDALDLGVVTAMLSGALNEAALVGAEASDTVAATDSAIATLRRMLLGLAPLDPAAAP